MKLYYAPGACSMGIHTLLEEIGLPFEATRVDIRAGDTTKPPFIDINPKGKVPVLQLDDGSVLTEYPVVAQFLARHYPAANLSPADEDAGLRAAEAMEYCVATIHMQGFARIIRPGNFSPNKTKHDAIKARGQDIMQKGYALMDKALGANHYLAGQFSAADTALFYVEYWGAKRGMELPPHCAAHLDRMLARPSVQRILASEGLAS